MRWKSERDLEAGAPQPVMGFAGVRMGRSGLLHVGHGLGKIEESFPSAPV